MKRLALVILATTLPVLAVAGCKKKQQQQAYPPYQQQPTAYPTQTAPYPTATATVPPAATVAPTTGVPLSTPGPLATPCTTDAQCLTAKCHPQFQKCVVPCTNNNDCVAPNQCMAGTGLCVPQLGMPGTGGTTQ